MEKAVPILAQVAKVLDFEKYLKEIRADCWKLGKIVTKNEWDDKGRLVSLLYTLEDQWEYISGGKYIRPYGEYEPVGFIYR